MLDVLMHEVLATILYNYSFIVIYNNLYTNGDGVTLYCTIYDLKKSHVLAPSSSMCWCPLKLAINNIRNM
jgi:hypothetical protein